MSTVPGSAAVTVPAGSPPAAGTPDPGVSAPPAGGSAAAPPAAPSVISWETAPQQLRSEYENQKAEAARLKAEADKWTKLGDYDQVSKLNETFSQKLTTATAIGKTLGYTDDQVREAMMEDPKGTLAYLQQEYAKPATATHADLDKRLETMLNERVKPIQDRYDETMNREANTRYETERDRLFKSHFADGLPDDNREELFEIVDSLIASDPTALQRLKFGNQVSDVARHMEQAKVIFMKRHNSYIAHERGRGSGTAPPNGAPPKSNGKGMNGVLSDGRPVKELFQY